MMFGVSVHLRQSLGMSRPSVGMTMPCTLLAQKAVSKSILPGYQTEFWESCGRLRTVNNARRVPVPVSKVTGYNINLGSNTWHNFTFVDQHLGRTKATSSSSASQLPLARTTSNRGTLVSCRGTNHTVVTPILEDRRHNHLPTTRHAPEHREAPTVQGNVVLEDEASLNRRPAFEDPAASPSTCEDPSSNSSDNVPLECGQHYYRKWISQRKALIGLQKLRKVDCGPKKIHWAWWRDKQIERKKKKKCI
ncbi:unnamed protein product [Amoebophrya sp. A25]|nr:unnamed protein product [Amoebophrya sp. A25]|eukprot:GSA25T00013741001.1